MIDQIGAPNLIVLMQVSSDGVMSMPNVPRLRDPEHPAAMVASMR